MSMHHLIGIGLAACGILVAAFLIAGALQERYIRNRVREQDVFQDDTMLLSARNPWDGDTYAYPQSWMAAQARDWEWPEDMTVTQFLDAAPEVTAEQPVVGIRTSGPFQVLDDIEDTDQWIAQMRAGSEAVIARLTAPLAATSWR